MSYDSVEQLREFSDDYGIGFHLLSDADSEVIRRFGILNVLIEPSESLYGIPFPGTYLVGTSGLVEEKFFHRHYATRTSAGTLLDTALGRALIHDESPRDLQETPHLRVAAFLADEDLKLEVASRLYVRIQVPDGFHVYGEPLPESYHPTTVHVQNKRGLRVGEPVYPPTRVRAFESLGVELNIYEGSFDVAVPITATHELLGWGLERASSTVDIPVLVRYQVCSDEVCYLPQTVDLEVDVPLSELTLPSR